MGWPFQQKPPIGWPIDFSNPLSDFVGYWPMLVGSGNKVFDSSGNNNTGTLGGSPTWGDSPYGSALDWNVITSYVNCGNLGHPSVFTIIVWLKITDFVTPAGYKTIIGRGNAFMNNCSYHFVFRRSAGEELLCMSRDGAGDINILSAVNTPLTLNQWHMVAVTWGSNVSGALYIDGKSRTLSIQNNYNGTDGGYNTYLGKIVSPSWQGMLGSMSHAMIYNSILTASEITLLYREPFNSFWWPTGMTLFAGGFLGVPTGIPILRRRIEAA